MVSGLVLWVGDKPMAKTKPVAWPLLKTGAVDLFAPFPIGVDPRGRPITKSYVVSSPAATRVVSTMAGPGR